MTAASSLPFSNNLTSNGLIYQQPSANMVSFASTNRSFSNGIMVTVTPTSSDISTSSSVDSSSNFLASKLRKIKENLETSYVSPTGVVSNGNGMVHYNHVQPANTVLLTPNDSSSSLGSSKRLNGYPTVHDSDSMSKYFQISKHQAFDFELNNNKSSLDHILDHFDGSLVSNSDMNTINSKAETGSYDVSTSKANNFVYANEKATEYSLPLYREIQFKPPSNSSNQAWVFKNFSLIYSVQYSTRLVKS